MLRKTCIHNIKTSTIVDCYTHWREMSLPAHCPCVKGSRRLRAVWMSIGAVCATVGSSAVAQRLEARDVDIVQVQTFEILNRIRDDGASISFWSMSNFPNPIITSWHCNFPLDSAIVWHLPGHSAKSSHNASYSHIEPIHLMRFDKGKRLPRYRYEVRSMNNIATAISQHIIRWHDV